MLSSVASLCYTVWLWPNGLLQLKGTVLNFVFRVGSIELCDTSIFYHNYLSVEVSALLLQVVCDRCPS